MLNDVKNSHQSLEQEAQLALDAIKNAENMFNYSDDPELVECAIFQMESARRRYNYMLKRIKQQHLEG